MSTHTITYTGIKKIRFYKKVYKKKQKILPGSKLQEETCFRKCKKKKKKTANVET